MQKYQWLHRNRGSTLINLQIAYFIVKEKNTLYTACKSHTTKDTQKLALKDGDLNNKQNFS